MKKLAHVFFLCVLTWTMLLTGCSGGGSGKTATPVVLEPTQAIPINTLEVWYQEGFSDSHIGWELSTAGYHTEGDYSNGELVLTRLNNLRSTYSYARPHLTFDNFVLEMDGRWAGGAVGGQYGILFRYSDADNYYRFQIGNDGWYTLGKQTKGNWFPLLQGFSKEILRDGVYNRFHIEAVGNEIRCFVNNQYLGGVQDDDHTLGDIVLAAWLPEGTENFHAAFDNLVVAIAP
ncbi:MAG: DUF1080 domain-containing protein [Anaerolineae bacterium]|nr:DUF1080 domain-containing protein [Anaerolineae bacterium]